MSSQPSLFGPENLAASVQIPAAPKLVPHYSWPYPGMTPMASAQASVARSHEYFEMLAAVIKAQGGAKLTTKHVLSLVPADWRELCGKYVHATLPAWTAKDHGIEIAYTDHEGKGGHFDYKAMEPMLSSAHREKF